MSSDSFQFRNVMVVAFVKQNPLPSAFRDWPLHITLIPPWIEMESKDIDEAQRLLQRIAQAYLPLEVTGVEEALFGASKNIPVTRVESEDLHSIHNKLLESFTSMQASDQHFNHMWVGDDYNPHVTHQGENTLAVGETFTLDSLSLIERVKPEEQESVNKEVIFNASTEEEA